MGHLFSEDCLKENDYGRVLVEMNSNGLPSLEKNVIMLCLLMPEILLIAAIYSGSDRRPCLSNIKPSYLIDVRKN